MSLKGYQTPTSVKFSQKYLIVFKLHNTIFTLETYGITFKISVTDVLLGTYCLTNKRTDRQKDRQKETDR